MSDDIAVGTKVFTRVDKLRGLLESIPEWVSTVYIADDGDESKMKSRLYSKEYSYRLEILDLEYDAGLGAGRNAIIDAVREEYLLIVDPDHRVPDTAILLHGQLQERSDLGGVAGALVEPENGRIYCEAQDFREEQTKKGTKIVRGPRVCSDTKDIELVNNSPLVNFDLIPNAALFRTKCLQEQSWDPEYIIEGEHVDFYVAHWKRTDWEFCVSPSVIFPHYPGGDSEYMLNRFDPEKGQRSHDYFLSKWSYVEDDIHGWSWFSTGGGEGTTKTDRMMNILREEGAKELYLRTQQFLRNRYKNYLG